MSALMMPTDEPEVTDETRFWLTTRLYLYEAIRDHVGRFLHSRQVGPATVIRVEVSEVTYRSVYADHCDTPDEITLPLDDDWWSNRSIWESPGGTFSMRRSRGGHIDWWGP